MSTTLFGDDDSVCEFLHSKVLVYVCTSQQTEASKMETAATTTELQTREDITALLEFPLGTGGMIGDKTAVGQQKGRCRRREEKLFSTCVMFSSSRNPLFFSSRNFI